MPKKSKEYPTKSTKSKAKSDALELAYLLLDLYKESKIVDGQNNAQQFKK